MKRRLFFQNQFILKHNHMKKNQLKYVTFSIVKKKTQNKKQKRICKKKKKTIMESRAHKPSIE